MVRGQHEYLMYPKTHQKYVKGMENTMNSLQNLSNPPSPKTSLFHFHCHLIKELPRKLNQDLTIIYKSSLPFF
jgi:hypothetical protein